MSEVFSRACGETTSSPNKAKGTLTRQLSMRSLRLFFTCVVICLLLHTVAFQRRIPLFHSTARPTRPHWSNVTVFPAGMPSPTCVFPFELVTPADLKQADTIRVSSSLPGRTGNRLVASENMIIHSLRSRCSVEIPDDLVPKWQSQQTSYKYKDTMTVNGTAKNCSNHDSRFWYYGFKRGNVTSQEACVTKHILRKYFGINATHAFGKKCPSKPIFAVHVRSGDIVDGTFRESDGAWIPARTVHRLYGPFPTAYFDAAMRGAAESGFDVVVFCETLRSPTCMFFKKVARDKKIQLRVAQDLLSDLHLMMCAKELVLSKGSFRHILALNAVAVVHDFTSSTDKCVCTSTTSNRTQYYRIHDEAERTMYRHAIFESNWTNSANQRHIVDDDYEIESFRCL